MHYRYCWVDIGFDAVVDMVVYISADVWLIYWSSITHYLKKKKKSWYSTDMSPTLFWHFTATLPRVSPLLVNNWLKVCWYMSILPSYFATSQASLQENRIMLLGKLMKVLKCLEVLWLIFFFFFFFFSFFFINNTIKN